MTRLVAESAAWSATLDGVDRRGVLLVLRSDGVVGLGEATPMPGYADEELEVVRSTVEGMMASPRYLAAIDSGDPAGIDRALVRARHTSSAAAFALETAALDLVGRRAGVPMAVLLRTTSDPRRVAVNAVARRGVSVEDTIAHARAAWAAGVRALKLKVGWAVDEEIAIAERLREAFGDELELRLDANGAWDLLSAPERLVHFAGSDPVFCEQPVPPADLCALPFGELAVAVAADESVCQGDGLAEVLSLAAGSTRSYVSGETVVPPPNGGGGVAFPVAALVIKPAAVGGLLPARRIARLAARRGIPVVLTHLFDGPVALAACAELASVLDPPPLACGLAAHDGLSAWGGPPPQIHAATAGSADRPGLGVAIPALP